MEFNIKEILAAISEIDKNPDKIIGRQSITYDLHYNNEIYPPILVLSEANKLRGENELTLDDFGSTEKAFEIFRKLGSDFLIKPKTNEEYSYVTFFQELTKQLLTFKDNQPRLIQILKDIGNLKNLDDYDGKNYFPLNEIDPFTFYAFFMKIKNYEKRKLLFRKLKQHIKIPVATPDGFSGVPSAQAMKAWYFPYIEERKSDDISTLWELAEQAVNGAISNETFQRALKIKAVKLAKLTQGLFYLDPEKFYPIDAHTTFIEKAGISTVVNSVDDYNRILLEIKSKFNLPFYEVSHEAWKYDNENVSYSPQEIKKLFKEWLEKNKPSSASAYFSNLNKTVQNLALERGFIESSIYEVYVPQEVQELKDKLDPIPEFHKSQAAYSNALGRYYDFCLELDAESKSHSYWVFQANPTKIYRIIDALKVDLLSSWLVNQNKKDIKIGDKVILWVSGDDAGVYALATVISNVESFANSGEELEFYIDKSKNEISDRVKLKMDHNLVNNPILKKAVLEDPILKELKQGTQGTNFPATQNQYERIIEIINSNTMNTNNKHPLNQILFGPPGTGKTYNTISEAIKIVDPDFYNLNSASRNKLQDRFNELLIKDWQSTNGQIAFCTFHQSFSYEDFVEGIKPRATDAKQVYYEIEDGIFKNICRHADAVNNAKALVKDNLISLSQADFNSAVFYKISLGDSTKEEDKEIYNYCVNNDCISIGFGEGIDFTGKDETEVNNVVAENKLDAYTASQINYFKNYLAVGNYVVVSNGNSYIRAIGKVTGEYEFKDNGDIRYDHYRKVEWLFSGKDIPVNEFYNKGLQQKTIYKLKSELIKPEFFVRENKKAEIKDEPKNFVIIIDEINRGNVSSIFGELITLIEPTKRAGCPEQLSVVLPYSKSLFTVPQNVFVVGTMNTADRSIESLDTALRRRFSFKEMSPKSDLIKTEGKSKGVIEGIDLIKLLDKINDRIEKLIDKDHKIGHSYFISVDSIQDLQLAFKDKVIPLLEEYFFGDFGKIGLVLGSSFVKKEVSEFEFAKFEEYDSQTEQDLKQRAVYLIKPVEDWDFKSVYEART